MLDVVCYWKSPDKEAASLFKILSKENPPKQKQANSSGSRIDVVHGEINQLCALKSEQKENLQLQGICNG